MQDPLKNQTGYGERRYDLNTAVSPCASNAPIDTSPIDVLTDAKQTDMLTAQDSSGYNQTDGEATDVLDHSLTAANQGTVLDPTYGHHNIMNVDPVTDRATNVPTTSSEKIHYKGSPPNYGATVVDDTFSTK